MKDSNMDEFEKGCIKKCLDQQIFFDNATYEFDSAAQMAAAQGKPKKAFIYFNRRIDDLTTGIN